MLVYALEWGDYDEHALCGILSSRQKAESFRNQCIQGDFEKLEGHFNVISASETKERKRNIEFQYCIVEYEIDNPGHEE